MVLTCLLAAAAAVLGLSLGTLPGVPGARSRRAPTNEETAAIGAVVDSLLTRNGIDPSRLATWKVQIPGAHRVVSRLRVPPDFFTLEFNHQLNLALEPVGARVVATERAGDGTVSMHCVRGGLTVRSITFVPDPGIRQGKEAVPPAERRGPSSQTRRQ